MQNAIETSHAIDHLSWSSVQLYRACPRQFEFHYVEKAPEERVGSSLLLGGAVHSAAELIHEARLSGEPEPTDEDLLSAFDAEWRRSAEGRAEVHYSSGEDAASLRGLAGRMLSVYRSQASHEGVVVAVEEEVRFRLLPDLPPVEARLDLVEAVGSDLVITDLKTSKCAWSDAKLKENVLQLVLYAHAALPLLRALGLVRIIPRFLVLTKAKATKAQVLKPEVGREEVDKLKTTFAETWDCIQRGWFPKSESWRCPSCPYRNQCLGH